MDNLVFKTPEFLWLLILLPIIAFLTHRFKFLGLNNLKFSNLDGFDSSSFKSRIYPIINIFRLITLLLVIVALARPQLISNITKTKTSSGIDIVITVDISSSMLAQDLKPNRLEALKKVASEFINNLVADVKSFTKDTPQSDDITALYLIRKE